MEKRPLSKRMCFLEASVCPRGWGFLATHFTHSPYFHQGGMILHHPLYRIFRLSAELDGIGQTKGRPKRLGPSNPQPNTCL